MIDFRQLTRREQIRLLRRLAEAALTRYTIGPSSLSLLNHSYHTTFLVTGSDGSRYVLHVLRPEEEQLTEARSKVRVESELWWLDRLRADLDLAVPTVVRAPTGEGVVSVADSRPRGCPTPEVPEARLCTLFRWIEGRFLLHRLTPAHLEQVGRLTGRLHNHSAQLTVPPGFDRPLVDRTDGETEEFVARLFADHVSAASGDVMRAVVHRVRWAQEKLGRGSHTYGLIHADIHQKNYMFSDGELRLIDFGDCGWGHYLYDLAVTVHQLGNLPQKPALRSALLAGYRQVRDLSPAHEALIDAFCLLRELQDITWFVQERDDPTYSARAAQVANKVTLLARLLASGE